MPYGPIPPPRHITEVVSGGKENHSNALSSFCAIYNGKITVKEDGYLPSWAYPGRN